MRESFTERKQRERRWRSKRRKEKFRHRWPEQKLRVDIQSKETHKSHRPKGRCNCTKGCGERYRHILSSIKNIPFLSRYLEGDIIISCASSGHGEDERPLTWDSDSFVIGIDQHSSAAISNNKDHFISYQPCTVNVVGVDGVPRGIAAGKGTIQWWIEDDQGIARKILCEKAWHVPSCPKCLLPPQHFARYGNTHREKTTCLQKWDRDIFIWGPNGEYTRTINMGKRKAVPDVISAQRNSIYAKYAQVTSQYVDVETLETSFSTLVSDDEGSELGDKDEPTSSDDDENLSDFMQPQGEFTESENQAAHVIPDDVSTDNGGSATDSSNQDINDLNPPESPDEEEFSEFEVQEVPEDLEVPASTDQAELLRWHYRLGNCSFFKLRQMAFWI